MTGTSREAYSVHYLTAVTAVTVVVAAVAVAVRNGALAFSAAILGLYALHLLSIRFILDGHRRQAAALSEQWELLQQLVGGDGTAPEALRVPALADLESAPGAGDGRAADVSRPEPALAAVAAHGHAEVDVPAFEPPPHAAATDPAALLDATPTVPEPRGGREGRTSDRGDSEVPIPRHFALGTVALIRDILTPAEVARVLLEQRKRPDCRFATLAVEMGLLTESEREELLLAQQEGLFTDAEMREARQKLRQFREDTARAMAEFD